MQVFLPGSTGVLGRALIRQLRAQGHGVVALVRDEKGEALVQGLGAEAKRGDLFNPIAMEVAAQGCDVVIRAATSIPRRTRPRPSDWEENDRIRVDGTRALVDATARIGAHLYLQESITWVALPPDGGPFDETSPPHPDPVTRSALEAEAIARMAGEERGFAVGTLRFGMFYGPGAYHTRLQGELLARRRMPIVGDPRTPWSVVHVDDAASAVVAAVETGRGGMWHIVDDRAIPQVEFLGIFARLLGAPPPRRIPRALARLLLAPYLIKLLTTPHRTSNARAKAELHWSPRYPTAEEGLPQVVETWKAEGFPGGKEG